MKRPGLRSPPGSAADPIERSFERQFQTMWGEFKDQLNTLYASQEENAEGQAVTGIHLCATGMLYFKFFVMFALCVKSLLCFTAGGTQMRFFVCFEIGKFLRAFFVCFFASCLCYVYKFGFASDLMIIIMIIRQKFSPLTGLFVEPWLHPERTTTHRWLSIRTVNVCGRGRAGGAAGHHQAGSGGAPPSRHTPYQQGGQCMGRSVMNNRNSNVSPPISPQGIFLFKYIHISSSPRLWTPPPGPTNQRTTHLPL